MKKKILEERIGEGHISHEFLEHPLSEQVSHRLKGVYLFKIMLTE